jgi:hypothetical protein
VVIFTSAAGAGVEVAMAMAVGAGAALDSVSACDDSASEK